MTCCLETVYQHAFKIIIFVLLQTQYIFIHNALDELLTCGDTEVAAANMRIVIGKLCRPAEEGSSISGFQKQYEVSTPQSLVDHHSFSGSGQ